MKESEVDFMYLMNKIKKEAEETQKNMMTLFHDLFEKKEEERKSLEGE